MTKPKNPIQPMDDAKSDFWGCAYYVGTGLLVFVTAFVVTCLWARGGWH